MPKNERARLPTGRPPTPFDQSQADIICEQLALGRSLRKIVLDPGMPTMNMVFKWLHEIESFREQYAQAREDQADALFDEILDIVDDSSDDWETRKHFAGADESPQINGDAIARARLRTDARKWMAGKLRPKKYGDYQKVDTTVDVSDDMKELLTQVNGKTRTK